MSLLTLPNCLSLSRVVLAGPAAWALASGAAHVALALLVVVVCSDLVDGVLARRAGTDSPFGTLLDHAADAAFVSVVAGAAAYLGLLPAALPALIAAAFVQYAVDAVPADGAGPRPSRLGRWNGIAYFVAVALAISVQLAGGGAQPVAVLRAFGWLLVVTTLASMAARAAWRWRRGST